MTTQNMLNESINRKNCGLMAHNIKFSAALTSECYSSFHSFVSQSPEDYKHELKHFIYPVFVHLYLESIAQGEKLGALELHEQYSKVFTSTKGYDKAVVELLEIQSVDDISTHTRFKSFRSSKVIVRLSNDCFNYFLDYLKNDTDNILLVLINLYFSVRIVHKDDDYESLVEAITRSEDEETKDKSNMDGDSKVGTEAKTSSVSSTKKVIVDKNGLDHSGMKNLQKFDGDRHSFGAASDLGRDFGTSLSISTKKSRAMTSSRMNINSNSAKKTSKCSNGMLQTSAAQEKKHIKCSNVSDAISKTNGLRHRKKSETEEDVSRKMSALKAAFDKVSKLPQPVPFLRSYSINCEAHRSLCDVKISWDEKLMAGAFEDSSIEICSLIQEPLHIHSEDDADVSAMRLHCIDKPPKRCSLRQLQVLRGHGESVYGLSFNYLSNILLSCSGDTMIRAWNMDSYKNVAIYRGHNYPVLDVDCNLFSSRFASSSIDATCRLWDMERTFPLSVLVGHKSGVGCIKFHPNGKYLATGSADKSIILWHSQEARQVRVFHGHDAQILTLAFSLDGKFLASAGVDRTVKIWDIAAGKLICDLQRHQSAVYSLCFNSNTSLLASAGLEKDINIWNVEECIADYKSSNGKEGMKADSYFRSSIETQCSTVQFVRFSRKNHLVSVGLSSNRQR